MVLFVGYHATNRSHRNSIRTFGLSVEFARCEPPGVYVFDPHMENFADVSTAARCGWASGPTSDLWRVGYCGPMQIDPCLTNAVILPSIADVTLVTGNE